MTTTTTTGKLFPLIKKTHAEKVQRFAETIRKHREKSKQLSPELRAYEFSVIETFMSQCNKDPRYSQLKQHYSCHKISNGQFLVRMIAQRFDDPLLLLERNWRPPMYDQEAWSEDEEAEKEARRRLVFVSDDDDDVAKKEVGALGDGQCCNTLH